MDNENVAGAALALASMIAQNTNRPLPIVEQVDRADAWTFRAWTPGGDIRVTVESADSVVEVEGFYEYPDPDNPIGLATDIGPLMQAAEELAEVEPELGTAAVRLAHALSGNDYPGPLISDVDRLDYLARTLDLLVMQVNNPELVPDRYDDSHTGLLADSDAEDIRRAWRTVSRLHRWAKHRYPGNPYPSYVNYRVAGEFADAEAVADDD